MNTPTYESELSRRNASRESVTPHDATEHAGNSIYIGFDDGDAAADEALDANSVLNAGTVIAERYEILRMLGTGGMGAVYLGEHLKVGRKVAIKVLHAEWSAVPEVAGRFAAEARTASAIGHPGIVDVLDAGELADGRLFLVMEFLDGEDLGQALDRYGDLPALEACELLRPVAEAIGAAHEAGIVHRDLKPDNIIVTEQTTGTAVKVLDFGVASNQAPQQRQRSAAATTPGMVIGTPEHMSPEQALGEPAGPHFDIYALGSVLFTLIAGRPPFVDDNPLKVLAYKQTTAAPSLDQFVDGLPAELVALIDDSLAIDVDRRPPTAEAFVARLDGALAILKGQVRPTAVETIAPPPAATKRRASALVAVALVGGLAAAVVGLVIATSPGDEGPEGAGADAAAKSGPVPSELAAALTADDGDPKTPPEDVPAAERSAAVEAATNAEATAEPAPTGTTTGAAPDEAPAQADEAPAQARAKPKPTDAAKKTKSGAKRRTEFATQECATVRDQASVARDAYHWSTLLGLADKRRACWERRSEARKLETQARMELGDFAGCVKASSGLRDKQVIRWRELCRKRGGL